MDFRYPSLVSLGRSIITHFIVLSALYSLDMHLPSELTWQNSFGLYYGDQVCSVYLFFVCLFCIRAQCIILSQLRRARNNSRPNNSAATKLKLLCRRNMHFANTPFAKARRFCTKALALLSLALHPLVHLWHIVIELIALLTNSSIYCYYRIYANENTHGP